MPYLLLTALILAAAPAAADELPAYPFVFAEGSAAREVAPDVAQVGFRIEIFHPAADAGLRQLEERSRQVAAGVAEKDVTAFEVVKRAVRENGQGGEPLAIKGYEVGRTFSAVLRDVKRYDALVRALLALPNVVDVGAAFDVSNRKRIEQELVTAAVYDARAKADRMASAADLRVGGAQAISQAPFGAIPGRFGMGGGGGPVDFKAMRAANGDLFFVPDTISLQADVNVLYRLENR